MCSLKNRIVHRSSYCIKCRLLIPPNAEMYIRRVDVPMPESSVNWKDQLANKQINLIHINT